MNLYYFARLAVGITTLRERHRRRRVGNDSFRPCCSNLWRTDLIRAAKLREEKKKKVRLSPEDRVLGLLEVTRLEPGLCSVEDRFNETERTSRSKTLGEAHEQHGRERAPLPPREHFGSDAVFFAFVKMRTRCYRNR